MKTKAPPKRTAEEIRELTRDLVELKERILPALSRICSNYEELVEENRILRQALDEIQFEQNDFDELNKSYSELTARYIAAKSLINIPDNIADMVKEIIRTRLLVWDKTIADIDSDPERFDTFTALNSAFQKNGGGKNRAKRKS